MKTIENLTLVSGRVPVGNWGGMAVRRILQVVMKTTLIPRRLITLTRAVVLTQLVASGISRADTVTDWNAHLEQAIRTAAVGVGFQPRHMALVQTAVYDA